MIRRIDLESGAVVVVSHGITTHCYFLNGLKNADKPQSERLAELGRLISSHPVFGRVGWTQLKVSAWVTMRWESAFYAWVKLNALSSIIKVQSVSDQSGFAISYDPSSGQVVTKVMSARLLIVDDSKAMRMALKKALSADHRIEVIGEAASGAEALKLISSLQPDVLTLDIQMPNMSGVELLHELNRSTKNPPASVMVSALGLNEGREVMNALEAGAFDYFQKPEASELMSQGAVLAEKLIAAVEAHRRGAQKSEVGNSLPYLQRGSQRAALDRLTDKLEGIDLLCIGASTGGTEAIRKVLGRFPTEIPPVVIVQHIPPVFSKAFADRLNSLNPFEVREAVDGDVLRPGLVLVAPGGIHVEVDREGAYFKVRFSDAAPVNRFKPSVDVMFHSAARWAAKHKLTGIILTGMGNDGAKGLLAMRQAGARTIGQDEESSVVYGMPRAAFEAGATQEVMHLDQIAEALTRSNRISALDIRAHQKKTG